MFSGSTTIKRKYSDQQVYDGKDKLFLFKKQMRWLWVSFFKFVLKQDLRPDFWIVKGRGLQSELDWYARLDAIDTMIHKLQNLLDRKSLSIEKITTLIHDIEKNILLLQTLILNRLPQSQRSLEEYFLSTEEQKQKQYKKRRLSKGIRF